MPYIYSTLSAPCELRLYTKREKEKLKFKDAVEMNQAQPTLLDKIIIPGGANVAQVDKQKGWLYTPKGVSVFIPDEKYQWVKEEKLFQHFLKEGFIKVSEESLGAADHQVKDLEPRDKSAPPTIKEYDEESKKKLKNVKVQGSTVELTGISTKDGVL